MKILLVEDSRVLRERIRDMITATPLAVLVAETDNEQDACAQLKKCAPDIVVLDLRLRNGSGLSVLEHIKAMYPKLISIILTNFGQPEYRDRCMDLGADYFFDKSRDIEAFEDLLAQLSSRVTTETDPS